LLISFAKSAGGSPAALISPRDGRLERRVDRDGQLFGQLLRRGTMVFGIGWRTDRRVNLQLDPPRSRKDLRVRAIQRPSPVRPRQRGWHDGRTGRQPNAHRARLELAEMAVLGVFAFREDAEDVAGLESAQRFFERSHVGPVAVDGNAAAATENPVERRFVERLVPDDEPNRARHDGTEDDGVERVDVIGGEDDRAVGREVFEAFNFEQIENAEKTAEEFL
jgi:hypothetical protein